MPREKLHWHVLDVAASKCADGAIKESIKKYPDLGYLGAVLHDTPYYYRYGGDLRFALISDMMHGVRGEDPFRYILDLANKVAQNPDISVREKMCAVLFGMLSHYAVDATCHPAINYFTGNYYAEDRLQQKRARTKHRCLEVFLDSWAADTFKPVTHYDLDSKCKGDIRFIAEHLAETIGPFEFTSTNAWLSSISSLCRCLRSFQSDIFGATARAINLLTLRNFDEIDALFSFGRRKPNESFSKPFSYSHPVTGHRIETSWERLTEEAVAETLRVLPILSKVVDGKTISRDEISDLGHGKSMETGVPGVSYFDQRWR